MKNNIIIAGCAIWSMAATHAMADDGYRLVHSFVNGPGGFNPLQVVVHKDSAGEWALYGATEGGGLPQSSSCSSFYGGCGLIYKLTPPVAGSLHWTETRLYLFRGGNDGSGALSGLVFDASGAAYGTTEHGGPHDCGIVFRLTPPRPGQYFWNEEILHSFDDNDACFPASGVVLDKSGAAYGVAPNGASNGIVYKLTPPMSGSAAWGFSTLHHFTIAEGSLPVGGLVADQAGALYGTNSSGYVSYNRGSVFKLTPPAVGQSAWTYMTLYAFPDFDGGLYAGRSTLIRDASGTLYGASAFGGTDDNGGVYSLTPPLAGKSAWTFRILHRFSGLDGGGPGSLAFLDGAGVLFGMTVRSPRGDGLIYKLTPPAVAGGEWSETKLHDFASHTNSVFGPPTGPLVRAPDGVVYGAALQGYSPNAGIVFKLLGQ